MSRRKGDDGYGHGCGDVASTVAGGPCVCACRGLSVQVAEHDRVSTDKCLRDDVCERDECADVPGLLVESDHGQCTSHCERLDGTSVCAV
jgi:hypothetical protein